VPYQLVLQFRGDSLADLDAIVALEETLTEQLGHGAEVDGHDVGSGEANLFVKTSDPVKTFASIQPFLDRANLLREVTVAYRPLDGGNYTVVWPRGSSRAFSVA